MALFSETETGVLVGVAERQFALLLEFAGMSTEQKSTPARKDGESPAGGMRAVTLPMLVEALREMKSRGLPLGPAEVVLEEFDNYRNENTNG